MQSGCLQLYTNLLDYVFGFHSLVYNAGNVARKRVLRLIKNYDALSIKNGPSLSSFASPSPSFCDMPTQANCHEHVSDGDESPPINERFLLSSG